MPVKSISIPAKLEPVIGLIEKHMGRAGPSDAIQYLLYLVAKEKFGLKRDGQAAIKYFEAKEEVRK